MQQLVDTLLPTLDPKALRTSSQVTKLTRDGGRWNVIADGVCESFDAVVIATPAHVAGSILEGVDAGLAADLSCVSYSSSVIVNLVYSRKDIAGRDRGFGFLVPRSEGHRMLAGTFVHNKFPHRAPEDRAIVRGFIGGLRDPEAIHMSDEDIWNTVRGDLRTIAGITAEPLAVRIHRWNRAMSQPSPGHLDRIARIEAHVNELPGLELAGNYFRGIGVPDCVRTGREAASKAAGNTAESGADAKTDTRLSAAR
jgi:oxygen-dependent protoporphyrinogen oxidase